MPALLQTLPTYRGVAAQYGACRRKSRNSPTSQAETVGDHPSQSDEGSTEIRVPSESRHLGNVDAATTSSNSDVSDEEEEGGTDAKGKPDDTKGNPESESDEGGNGDRANITGPPIRGERKRAEMAGNHPSPSERNIDTAPAGDIDSTNYVDASTSRPSTAEASSAVTNRPAESSEEVGNSQQQTGSHLSGSEGVSESGGGAEVPAEATHDSGIDGTRIEASGPTTGEKDPSGFACEECQRVFGSKAGKQLHRKRVHPVEYNSGLPEPSSRNQFPEEVLADLARAALEWPGRAACGQGVCQFICSRLPAYSVSAINALRKRPHYRDMEKRMRLETGAAADHA